MTANNRSLPRIYYSWLEETPGSKFPIKVGVRTRQRLWTAMNLNRYQTSHVQKQFPGKDLVARMGGGGGFESQYGVGGPRVKTWNLEEISCAGTLHLHQLLTYCILPSSSSLCVMTYMCESRLRLTVVMSARLVDLIGEFSSAVIVTTMWSLAGVRFWTQLAVTASVSTDEIASAFWRRDRNQSVGDRLLDGNLGWITVRPKPYHEFSTEHQRRGSRLVSHETPVLLNYLHGAVHPFSKTLQMLSATTCFWSCQKKRGIGNRVLAAPFLSSVAYGLLGPTKLRNCDSTDNETTKLVDVQYYTTIEALGQGHVDHHMSRMPRASRELYSSFGVQGNSTRQTTEAQGSFIA
ncbi:hypothetical protein B0J14DRAFT_633592 [Halenospora varia]|nr:hypothetical protein B0J14DRAFT_633592 [Halenospora varia]